MVHDAHYVEVETPGVFKKGCRVMCTRGALMSADRAGQQG